MDDRAGTERCASRPIQAATCPPYSSHKAAPPATFPQFPRELHHQRAPQHYDSHGMYPQIWFSSQTPSLGVFSPTWTRRFPCRCIQVRITAGRWHSWEWTTVSQSWDNVLLSRSAALKYFMHSSPHQEASSLQNNVSHATKTGLPRAARALCQLLLPGGRGCLLVWYSIQADPSDN